MFQKNISENILIGKVDILNKLLLCIVLKVFIIHRNGLNTIHINVMLLVEQLL